MHESHNKNANTKKPRKKATQKSDDSKANRKKPPALERAEALHEEGSFTG